jgi:hypothetical protein
MQDAFEELVRTDGEYRDSLPDITAHTVRLLYSRALWRSILRQHMTGLALRKHIDAETAAQAANSGPRAAALYLLGALPFLGRFLRRVGGHRLYRRHYRLLWSSPSYIGRTWKARRAEALIRWLRDGRVTGQKAERLNQAPLRFAVHLPLSLLPAGLHRFFSDRRFARQRLDSIFLRPLRLYFRADAREQWLRDTISQGEESGMLTPEESGRIRSRIKEPFIQKYLKSLAVHVCTVPITQIVSVLVAVIYVRLHPELSWQEASLRAGLILGLFQVIPISPGSLARGLYVTFLVLRERNFKDYNIAFFLSFFKYIGYLAFPIQMQRVQRRRQSRAGRAKRSWHTVPALLVCLGILIGLEAIFARLNGNPAGFNQVWWAALWVPVLLGFAVTAGAGGTSLGGRLGMAALSGALLGWLYAVSSALSKQMLAAGVSESLSLLTLLGRTAAPGFWQAFLFSLLALVAVLVAETRRIPA